MVVILRHLFAISRDFPGASAHDRRGPLVFDCLSLPGRVKRLLDPEVVSPALARTTYRPSSASNAMKSVDRHFPDDLSLMTIASDVHDSNRGSAVRQSSTLESDSAALPFARFLFLPIGSLTP